MSHDPKEWCKSWRKTDLLFQKWHDKFGKFWPKHSTVSKVSLVPIVQSINVWPKKVQKSYLSWPWRMIQNLKKTNLWFEKWYGELGKFSPEHSKVSVLRLWWGPYVQSRECMSLKLTKELWQWQWRMMQNFKRNWIFISNLTWEIWPLGLENIKNLLFNWLLWLKYVMLELKMYSGGMSDSNENWGKIWRKTDSCFQKWHEKFDKFALVEINE